MSRRLQADFEPLFPSERGGPGAGTPTYLSDQATYDFIRNLIKNGCVRPLLVDLLADKGMKGIGEAMTKVGLPVRTLYLSNAEEYWTYTDQFRANVRGLPTDAKSLALHTQSSNANEDYRYNAQPLDTFKASPLVNRPGEKYAYSTHGYVLLSAVVQRAGSQRFADQVKARLADPLRMTGFHPDYEWEAIPHRAVVSAPPRRSHRPLR